MDRLSFSFVLGYHGCDRKVGGNMLAGNDFTASKNDYDWLGSGIYFWEANPARGVEFAHESMARKGSKITDPFVIGAVIDLGRCLDLTTSSGIAMVCRGYESLQTARSQTRSSMPVNTKDKQRRKLDCAVIERVHAILDEAGEPAFDSVRGVFVEGEPAYDGAGYATKTHIQIAVRNPDCIKGVFRVPSRHLTGSI